MKTYYTVFTMLLLSTFQSNAQQSCFIVSPVGGQQLQSCTASSAAYTDKYNDFFNEDLSFWIPTATTVTKIIRINFLIIQTENVNSPGNFSATGSCDGIHSDEYFLYQWVDNLNALFANLEDPSDNGGLAICGACNVPDNTKIQFEVQGFHYIQDDTYYGSTSASTIHTLYAVNPETEISIIMTNAPTTTWSATLSTYNLRTPCLSQFVVRRF